MSLSRSLAALRHAPGDPRVVRRGPGSLQLCDRTARALGWSSIAFGLIGMFAARPLTGWLGLRRAAPIVRFAAARELATGVATLSVDPRAGLWSRVGGDAIDLGLLGVTLRRRNARRDRLTYAAVGVAAVLLVDLLTAAAVHRRHRRYGLPRDYSDRSGFAAPPLQVRGAAADFATPAGLRQALPWPSGLRRHDAAH